MYNSLFVEWLVYLFGDNHTDIESAKRCLFEADLYESVSMNEAILERVPDGGYVIETPEGAVFFSEEEGEQCSL